MAQARSTWAWSICRVRGEPFVIDKRPESTLDSVLKRDHGRVAPNRVGTTVEKEHRQSIPSEQNLLERNGLNARATLDEHLDQVQTLTLHRFYEGSVLLLLPRFVASEQFDKAVEAGVDGCQKGCSLDRWVGDDRFPGGDPSLDIVEPTTAARRRKAFDSSIVSVDAMLSH
ncbi:MAG: hypothetical protein IPP47_32995 [Bryobacterales bacterium]|nr:hypothetical protein [Bryobacterales bacterium]